jgi:hypothetical protein
MQEALPGAQEGLPVNSMGRPSFLAVARAQRQATVMVMVMVDDVSDKVHQNHNALRYTNRVQEASADPAEQTGHQIS